MVVGVAADVIQILDVQRTGGMVVVVIMIVFLCMEIHIVQKARQHYDGWVGRRQWYS